MTRLHLAPLLWQAMAACGAAQAAGPDTPTPSDAGVCRSAETRYFSCATRAGKWIALCGDASGAVQYRYGRSAAAVELAYPASPVSASSAVPAATASTTAASSASALPTAASATPTSGSAATSTTARVPNPASPATQALRFAHYSRAQTERYEVSFVNVGTRYAVFDYTEGRTRSAGVQVQAPGQPGRQLLCSGRIHSRIETLASRLPCDADNALNLGSCR